MTKFRFEVEDGSKGLWILPFIAFDWKTGRLRFWFGWIYWMVMIEAKGANNER